MGERVMADQFVEDNPDMEGEIARILCEVERDRDDMRRAQQEIDRLKVQTRAMLAQLEAA
jgi:hypothetical protein